MAGSPESNAIFFILIISNRDFLFKIFDKFDAYFSRIVSSKNIGDEDCLHLHLDLWTSAQQHQTTGLTPDTYHLQSPPDDPAQHVAKP